MLGIKVKNYKKVQFQLMELKIGNYEVNLCILDFPILA